MEDNNHVNMFFIGFLVFLIFGIFMYLSRYKKHVESRNIEAAINDLPDTCDESQNRSVSVNLQNETFFIPAGLLNKVYLNQNNRFVFNQPCTLQIKKTLEPKYYFELMFFDMPISALLFLGLAPVNFSSTLVPGLYDKTISLEITRGELFKDGSSLRWNSIGKFQTGDVLGVSIETIFNVKYIYKIILTKNGIPGSPIEFNSDIYLTPTVHSTAKSCFNVNLGQDDFIYDPHLISQQVYANPSHISPPLEPLPSYEES